MPLSSSIRFIYFALRVDISSRLFPLKDKGLSYFLRNNAWRLLSRKNQSPNSLVMGALIRRLDDFLDISLSVMLYSWASLFIRLLEIINYRTKIKTRRMLFAFHLGRKFHFCRWWDQSKQSTTHTINTPWGNFKTHTFYQKNQASNSSNKFRRAAGVVFKYWSWQWRPCSAALWML